MQNNKNQSFRAERPLVVCPTLIRSSDLMNVVFFMSENIILLCDTILKTIKKSTTPSFS